jgi:hypothetical protein
MGSHITERTWIQGVRGPNVLRRIFGPKRAEVTKVWEE